MSKKSGNEILNFLFTTPLCSINEAHVQDMLGWMGEIRTLQHETFPLFTVLTNYRWHAETLLFLVGLTEDFVDKKNKEKCSVNHFFRNFELLWSLSRLTKDENIDGFLNIQRFKLYWDQHQNSDQNCKFSISSDTKDSYLQNLGYGVAPHYWAAMLKWGLIEKERNEFPRLTNDGRYLFKVLKPYAKSSNQREYLNKWFEGKSLTRREIRTHAWKYLPKTETAVQWYSFASQKAEKERFFGPLWRVLKEDVHPDNILKFRKILKNFERNEFSLGKQSTRKFSAGDVLRRWVVKQLSISDLSDQDRALLSDLFRRCRQAEVLCGISNFLMSAMVLFTEQNENSSIQMVVARWASWLPKVQRTFLSFYKQTPPNSIFRKAFPKLTKNCSSEVFLRSILDRHLQVKGSQSLLREENNCLQKTENTPPNLDPKPLLEQLRSSSLNLPTTELSKNPDDLWRDFTELDFHWNRFAMWMRVV